MLHPGIKKFTPISKFTQPLAQTNHQMVSLGKVSHKVIENLNTEPSQVKSPSQTPSAAQAKVQPDQTQGQPQNTPLSFAQVVADASRFHEAIPSVEHRPEVHPVFLNFKRVGKEGHKIPLIQVATTVAKTVGEKNVDAIQPMRNGWQIYVKTDPDQVKLMSTGIELAGKSIDL